jgi:hypothetical protein
MTDREKDKKIAEWCGWHITELGNIADKNKLGYIYDFGKPCPHYATSDADAITLLPELVRRGYGPYLMPYNMNQGWLLNIFDGEQDFRGPYRPTISAAIVDAILQLPEAQ